MEPENVLEALANVWDELPGAVGAEWTGLYFELEEAFETLRATRNDSERAIQTADLILKFTKYPAARKRLHEAIQEVVRERQSTGRKGGQGQTIDAKGPGWSEVMAGMLQRFHTSSTTMYTDVTIPKRLMIGQRGVIAVRFTRDTVSHSSDARQMEVKAKQVVEVILRSDPEELEIMGGNSKKLRIEAGKDKWPKDTEPVVFYVIGRRGGTKSAALDFQMGGVTVSSMEFLIELVDAAVPVEETQAINHVVQANGPYDPPPDLEIRVSINPVKDGYKINYLLHSPNGAADYHHFQVRGPIINSSPEKYQEYLINKLENLSQGKDVSGSEISPADAEIDIDGVGRALYRELFTGEMQNEYRAFRNSVRTILLTSDEPYIPWEMIRPYDDDDRENVIDDDFLCMRFKLTRWLAGKSGPQARIKVSRLACIEAHHPPDEEALKYAKAEKQYITDFAAAYPGLVDDSPGLATKEELDKLLDEGGVSLYHFASHGNFNLDLPNESLIVLADGKAFRAGHLHGPRQTKIARDRPLVFMNACRVGRQGLSLTRLGGWAAAWVETCRCGAFIGPMFGVNDWLAFEFARTFFNSLRDNLTVSEAAQEARLRVRKLSPHQMTWLGYMVYAHPNARLEVGEKQAQAEDA
ncbi:MAG TPA: CHAT domain-containing protein [Blastocatellia bacterium]|jgi:hypothetical protein|nr:CHAT domain-containing protein [Blastocatellia bacterium]